MKKDDWWEKYRSSTGRIGKINAHMRKTLQEANIWNNKQIPGISQQIPGNDRDLLNCFYRYMLSHFNVDNFKGNQSAGCKSPDWLVLMRELAKPMVEMVETPPKKLAIDEAYNHWEFAHNIVDIFAAIYMEKIVQVQCQQAAFQFLYAIPAICEQQGAPYKELFLENIISSFITFFKNASEEDRSTLQIHRNMWNDHNFSLFTAIKLQELDLKIKKIADSEDIDSLVDFIEGKPLGAIPKRKLKEKVPKIKKVKNIFNRKHEKEVKEANKVTAINITANKSEENLISESETEKSNTIKIIEESEIILVQALDDLFLKNLCLKEKQDKQKASIDENNLNEKNSKSPDNASNLCTKMQEQKIELQHQLQQMEEKKTNIYKSEDNLVVKHSKEMAFVLNSKTDAEIGMQNRFKKLNVINSEVSKTDEKLNDLKKQIMNLEKTKTALISQVKPIEKEIELDEQKIKKLERKQNYLEGLCEVSIEKIQKEKESVALEMISLQKQINTKKVDIEKFQNSDLKEESETGMKTDKERECKPNEEMVDFLKTIIDQKEQALECPVCFETAKIPIYMCSESHLICFTCKLKMKDCPVCRRKYPEELIRNRYAEEDADKLSELYLKMDRINNRL